MTFVGGSQVVEQLLEQDLLSQWESKLFLPFLIVHSHETGCKITHGHNSKPHCVILLDAM